jgi:hypothetical protein
VTGQWFSLGAPVSSANKTDHDDITEILLKVALSTINQLNQPLSRLQDIFISNTNCFILRITIHTFFFEESTVFIFVIILSALFIAIPIPGKESEQ